MQIFSIYLPKNSQSSIYKKEFSIRLYSPLLLYTKKFKKLIKAPLPSDLVKIEHIRLKIPQHIKEIIKAFFHISDLKVICLKYLLE